jgi:hypothetical protein
MADLPPSIHHMAKTGASNLRISGTRIVPHGDRVGEVLTRAKYQMPDCLSELVDNSIDAEAKNVLIRFVRHRGILVDVWVVDDGNGIKESNFDEAMQFAGNNKHKSGDTGLYGVGLKTGSLAMADVLNVISKVRNATAHGRQWTNNAVKKTELSVLDDVDCEAFFNLVAKTTPWTANTKGTIVHWQEVKQFKTMAHSTTRSEEYLETQIPQLEQHLGLVFHRFLDRQESPLQIVIDVMDLETLRTFSTKVVKSIDPFRYPKSGAKGYPKNLVLTFPNGKKLVANAHIWPKGMKSVDFKIPKKKTASATDRQGIYIYRSNRLLMCGGWDEIVSMEAHRNLARIAIEITGNEGVGLEVTYDKTGVQFPNTFASALLNATSADGTSFEDYLRRADEVNRKSIKKDVEIKLPIPMTGVPVSVSKTFSDLSSASHACDIVWQNLRRETVFKVDLQRSRLIVNNAYKAAFNVGGGSGTRSTAVSLTLLVLSLSDVIGKQRKTNAISALESALNQILLAAIKEQP